MYHAHRRVGEEVATMDWRAQVEELLQSSLKLGKELKNFKDSTKAKLNQDSLQLDLKLENTSKNLRDLQEESDGLFARSVGFSEGILSLENQQKAHFSEVDEEIEREGRAVEQMEGSMARLREIIAIKNDPDWQYLVPPVTFTLDNFQERKLTERTWYSPYFYTHKYGYKMQLQVFPNGTGEGRGTHISVFVIIVPGEFDDLLTWPFCGIVTMHLVNQRKNGLNVVEEVSFTTVNNLQYREKPHINIAEEDRMGWGTFKLIAHTELGEGVGLYAQREYLKDNSLSFCVWSIDCFYQHH